MMEPASTIPHHYNQIQMNPANMPGVQVLNVNSIINAKDSRWLQLEVCREFQKNKCVRPETECKFAHPPANVEVQNGRVTACYDSIKGRCQREKPPCKYFHPPHHLKDQLLINGRNHLALKNAFMSQLGGGISPAAPQAVLPVQTSTPGYMASIPTVGGYPYFTSPMMTMGMTDGMASPLAGMIPQAVVPAQKVPRLDRIESGAAQSPVSMSMFSMPPPQMMQQYSAATAEWAKKRSLDALSEEYATTYPTIGVAYKRSAHDKSGLPMYQATPAGNLTYHQTLMQQISGQSFVPVTFAGHSGNVRFQ